MKRIVLVLLFALATALSYGQRLSVRAEVVKHVKITATERDSYVVPVTEFWKVTLVDGTKWVNDGGAGWEVDSGGGPESDPVFTAHPAFNVTSLGLTNAATAFGWGNHATAGYPNINTNNSFAQTNTFQQVLNLNTGAQFSPIASPAATVTFGGLYFDTSNNWNFETTPSSNLYARLNFSALTANRNLNFTDSDVTWNGQSLIGGGSPQTLSLSGINNTTLEISDGNNVVLPTLSATNQSVPNSATRSITTGTSARLNLGDSSGRTKFFVESNAIAQSEGTHGMAENATIYESSGGADNSIAINFDFATGTDRQLVATPDGLEYAGVALGAGGSSPNTTFTTVNTSREITDVDVAPNKIVIVEGTRTLTLGAGISTSNPFVMWSPYAVDSVNVQPLSGFTFQGKYSNGTKFTGNTDGITFKDDDEAFFIKRGSVFHVRGNVSLYNPPPVEYYTLANAANSVTEVNATTGAGGVANWTVTSVTTSPSPQNGTHSLKWTHGGPDNTTYTGEINLGTGLAASTTYTVTMYVNRFLGGNFTIILDDANGWTVDTALTINTTSDPVVNVWREITLTGTRNAGSTSKIMILANSNADTGNAIAVDNIRISE